MRGRNCFYIHDCRISFGQCRIFVGSLPPLPHLSSDGMGSAASHLTNITSSVFLCLCVVNVLCLSMRWMSIICQKGRRGDFDRYAPAVHFRLERQMWGLRASASVNCPPHPHHLFLFFIRSLLRQIFHQNGRHFFISVRLCVSARLYVRVCERGGRYYCLRSISIVHLKVCVLFLGSSAVRCWTNISFSLLKPHNVEYITGRIGTWWWSG